MANSKDQILRRLGISEGAYSQIREFLRKNVDWTAFAGGYEGFTALPEENLANLKQKLVRRFPALDGKDDEIVWIIKRRYRNHQTIKKRKEKRASRLIGERKTDEIRIVDEARTRDSHIDKRRVASINYLLNPS
ncbi:uncharacterized protein LAJ45_00721 [Morchella importuna]|uniref:uncharacterized protein n=1 Tax=Morchella sextelata TaxID=1174677 RepID=UPI001D054AFE|nr:uncharacterized protein H6S33_009355 [Morchella sextelata]XP_045977015.1 uncharacterized protein LAJ45_00721 [Morchella importuna]KAH0612975.1 hypothetical protein H6S33_009355 [Morchella sextelata]KAH8155711.1 hypothetical protein LAJ45_00721 [Morchella importuna]